MLYFSIIEDVVHLVVAPLTPVAIASNLSKVMCSRLPAWYFGPNLAYDCPFTKRRKGTYEDSPRFPRQAGSPHSQEENNVHRSTYVCRS